jgi:hypothetical protein
LPEEGAASSRAVKDQTAHFEGWLQQQQISSAFVTGWPRKIAESDCSYQGFAVRPMKRQVRKTR